MNVTFWGTRGSIASPGHSTAHYGGNTSCVEVEVDGQLYVLDCGTGARELGLHLQAKGNPIDGNILLTHSHWDHIQGIPFFAPLFAEGNQFRIFGPQDHTQRLNDTLAGQMQYRYFPVGLDQMAAKISYREMRDESFSTGPVVVSSHYVNHTTLTLAYRIQANGRSLVFATDTEPFSQQPRAWVSSDNHRFLHRRDEQLVEFFSGADLLIMDAQYTPHEYPGKIGWGHGTADYALDLAISAGVGTLVLFHHDPARIDSAVSVLEQLAQKRAAAEAPELEVLAAAEGLTLEFDGMPGADLPLIERSLPHFHSRVRIALVGEREEFVGTARKALGLDHYELVAFNDTEANSSDLSGYQPHLILLEYGVRNWDLSRLRRFLGRQSDRQTPVLAVVFNGGLEAAQEAFDGGAGDVIIEPFAASQLRSRVDACLLRAGVAVDRRIQGRRSGEPAVTAPR